MIPGGLCYPRGHTFPWKDLGLSSCRICPCAVRSLFLQPSRVDEYKGERNVQQLAEEIRWTRWWGHQQWVSSGAVFLRHFPLSPESGCWATRRFQFLSFFFPPLNKAFISGSSSWTESSKEMSLLVYRKKCFHLDSCKRGKGRWQPSPKGGTGEGYSFWHHPRGPLFIVLFVKHSTKSYWLSTTGKQGASRKCCLTYFPELSADIGS